MNRKTNCTEQKIQNYVRLHKKIIIGNHASTGRKHK